MRRRARTWPRGCTCRATTSIGSSRRSPASRPGPFRRRILLERSAYRLLTTGRTILDIAVEAGYGSHEAFTRAFTRAYGVRTAALARQADADPDRSTQRRPLPPARQPAAAGASEGDPHGPPHEDGRAPRLADRRDGRPRRAASTTPPRQADRDLGRRRRRPDPPIPAVPAGRPDGHVERRDGQPRLRLVRGGARADRVDARRLAVEGPTYLAHVREVSRAGPPRRHVRRRAVRAGRGVHLRRDDRPRADVRRTSPDARRGRADRRRDHRSRRRRSAAVGRASTAA